jgi:putative DNA methylase
MSIGNTFDIPLIAALALREKQIQQNHRPIIGVHKWFARRPGSLFRGLVLSEFSDDLSPRLTCAPTTFPGELLPTFIGGGTPLIEADVKSQKGSRTEEVGTASVSTTLADIL